MGQFFQTRFNPSQLDDLFSLHSAFDAGSVPAWFALSPPTPTYASPPVLLPPEQLVPSYSHPLSCLDRRGLPLSLPSGSCLAPPQVCLTRDTTNNASRSQNGFNIGPTNRRLVRATEGKEGDTVYTSFFFFLPTPYAPQSNSRNFPTR